MAWKSDPALDEITGRWFELAAEKGDVRIFIPRHQTADKQNSREPLNGTQPNLGRGSKIPVVRVNCRKTSRSACETTSRALLRLLLLQLEAVNLIGYRVEILGAVMSGYGNSDQELLAIELVNRLSGLALGLFRTF